MNLNNLENLKKIPPNFFKEQFQEIFPEGFSLKDEANAITAYAFRNGPIEELHAGENSDLLVNKNLSRITDDEMKNLMIDASNKIESLLKLKEKEPDKYYFFIKSYNAFYCQGWERRCSSD